MALQVMSQEIKAPKYEDEIVIGKIAKSFGVKGFLKVIPLTDFPERYNELKIISLYMEKSGKYTLSPDGSYGFEIEESELLPDFIKLKLSGINDKNAADSLRDNLVTIPLDERIERNEGEHYYFELIGCEVWEENNKLGIIKAIEDFGGGDLLKVEMEGSKKVVYIPYRDEFVERIDSESKKIYVKLIDGLIE